ncbi:PerC family transcriptional regulator, partial [Salmonella enterica]|nr:PerC family transcriptional regulator [Salmonella enterica]
RASTRWLLVMGDFECTEAQREWLLLRRNYCLAQISSPGASKAGYQRRDEMRGACT